MLAWEAAWFAEDVAEFILLTVLSLAVLRLEWIGAGRTLAFFILNVKAELMYIWQTQALGGQETYDFSFFSFVQFLSDTGLKLHSDAPFPVCDMNQCCTSA